MTEPELITPQGVKIPKWVPDPDKWNDDDYARALALTVDRPSSVEPERLRELGHAVSYYENKAESPETSASDDYHMMRFGVPRGWRPEAAAAPAPQSHLDTISERDPELTTLEAFAQGATNPFELGDEAAGVGGAFAESDAGRFVARHLPAARSALRHVPGGALLAAALPDLPQVPEQAGPMPGRQLTQGMGGPVDPRSPYEQERDRKRALQAQAARESPIAYGGGQLGMEVASSVPAMLVTGGAAGAPAAARALTMGERAIRASAAGAGGGALTAFGASQATDPLELGRDTIVGGGVGAVVGPLAGELAHTVTTAIPQLPARIRQAIVNREAGRIEAAHGSEAAAMARAAADPDSEAGQAMRAQILRAESPSALADSEQRAFEELTALGPPAATREAAQRAADPAVADEYSDFIARELDALGPDLELRELARQGSDPALLEEQTRKVTNALTNILEHSDEIEAYETIHRKMEIARKYMRRDGLDPQTGMDTADELARDIHERVQRMHRNTTKGTDEHRLIGRILPYLEEYNQPIEMSNPTPYDLLAGKWARLDQVKRDLQKILKHVKFNAPETEQLHGMESELRANLERPDLWGEGAADLQVRRNRAWHSLLQLMQTRDANPRRTIFTDARGIPSAAEQHYRARQEGDPAGVHGTLQDAGQIQNEIDYWKMGETPQRYARLGGALTDYIDPNPEMVARARAMQSSADQIAGTMDERLRQANAARALERHPSVVRDPAAGARRLLGSAGDPLAPRDPEIDTFRRWLASTGRSTESVDAVLEQRAAEAAAAREVAALPSAVRDPSQASALVRRAGGAVPDPDMAALEQWAALTGKDPSALQSVLAQRGEAVGAAEALGAAERNLPDPPLLERAASRWLSGGPGAAGVTGVANEAAQVMRPAERSIGQRARVIAQLEQAAQDPSNRRARAALEGMRTRTDQPVTGWRALLESQMSLQAGVNAGDLEHSRGHKLEGTIRRTLEDNPAALGPYEDVLARAIEAGTLGAALYKLEADPAWKQRKAQLAR